MKKFVLIIFFLSMSYAASATVFPKVYLADGITPLELADPNVPFVYRDIMAGTRLTIVLESDAMDYWSGVILLEDVNMTYGYLAGRGIDGWFPESCLPAAGPNVIAMEWLVDPCNQNCQGVDFYSDPVVTVPGDWFVVDYDAIRSGNCIVNLYHHNDLTFESELVSSLKFNHVPTRDLDGDNTVNYSDYSILAAHWQRADCNSNDCQGADLDSDFDVDINDLKLFSDFWLENL